MAGSQPSRPSTATRHQRSEAASIRTPVPTRSAGPDALEPESAAGYDGGAATRGFLVAFLNPKLAVFMLALFSQFLQPEAGLGEKALMAATVWLTDTLWYLVVALLVSHSLFYERLRARAQLIDRCFGVLLIVVALTVAIRALT